MSLIKIVSHPLLGLTFLALSFPLLATEDDLFFDMPIVLSANRLEQPASDAAVTVSVIDRATIKATGARTIPEVLRLIPGMQVGYSGNEFGDEPKYVVAYHGHSDQYSKQMQVLIDGRSIYDPFFGGINWKAIPVNIDDIERIEVSRGPNLATYGSNTFMAAINIITRTAAEDQGSYLRTNTGNHNIADLTYRYGGNRGKLDYRITASTLNDNGQDSANKNPNPDDTSSHNVDYRMDYQFNNHNTLSYQGGYGHNFQQADRNHDGVLPTARTVKNIRFFQFVKWENAINAKNTIQLQYYYNYSSKNDSYTSIPINTADLGYPPTDPFTLYVNAGVRTERHNLELTHFIYPKDNLRLVWGLSAQLDRVYSPLYLGIDKTVTHNQYRGFANIEWHVLHNDIINAGALVEKNDYTGTETSPRLSYTHAFNRYHKIRFGISKAIRSPFPLEVKADTKYAHDTTIGGTPTGFTLHDQVITGNPDLVNQQIISREIAYYGNFLRSTLLFNSRIFRDSVNNFINTKKVPVNNPAIDNVDNSTQLFKNYIESTTSGIEMEMDYHIDPTLRLIASGAILNITSNSHIIARSAPANSYSLLASKQFNEKYNASIAYYYVGKFGWVDATHGAYKILNLKFGRQYRFNQTRGSLSLVLKNLLGNYSDYKDNPRNPTAPLIVSNTIAFIEFRINY